MSNFSQKYFIKNKMNIGQFLQNKMFLNKKK